jgi:hypothetical protein
MVSQINWSSIDATFPIAGKDNDSQGFRDNFGYIKNGLEVAQGEITALENNSANTSDNNNFNNYQITAAVFRNNSEFYFDGGAITSNTAVTYANGPYQKFTIGGGPLTLTVTFPTGAAKVYKMRIELTGIDIAYSVGFAVTGSENIFTNSFANPVYVQSSVTSRIFDLWTTDSGTNTYIHEVTGNEGFYDNGSVSDTDTFSYKSGTYQKYIMTGDTELTVSGFPPAGQAGKIRLEIYADATPRTVSFAALNSLPVPTSGTIKMSTRVPDPFIITSSENPIILEFWSHDGGNTVFMDSLGTFT